jgi:hypothetical protein
MALIVSLAALLVGIAPAPADAHVCTIPVEIPVGEVSTVTVGVAAEVYEVTQVDVQIPAGFRLTSVGRTAGWTSAREGDVVRFTGGSIGPLTCAYFTLNGSAPAKGKLTFAATTHAVDGSTTVYGPGKFGAQEVYVGVKADPAAEDGSSGTSAVTYAGYALVGIGAVAAIVLVLRRRRAAVDA